MKTRLFALLFCSSAVLLPASAWSGEEKKWDLELAPLYLWAVNIDGDMGIRGNTGSVGVDFSNIWDNLEGVFTFRFGGLYNKKWGFVLDYNYLDIGKEQISDITNLEVSFKSQILNLAGSYRIMDGQHTLDGLAGIRYTALEAGLDLNNVDISLNGNQDWVDPVIGLRYGYQISDDWSVRLYGDIGGFGVSSDFTWQALGLVSYQPWEYVAIVAGYRAIGTDYENGSGADKFSYDATVYGPLAGIDIRW